MGEQQKKRKRKGKKRKRERKKRGRGNKPSYVDRIATLLYSIFERVPVVFYHATLC